MNYTLGSHLAIPCATGSALGSLDFPTDAGCLQRSPVCAWGELDLLPQLELLNSLSQCI